MRWIKLIPKNTALKIVSLSIVAKFLHFQFNTQQVQLSSNFLIHDLNFLSFFILKSGSDKDQEEKQGEDEKESSQKKTESDDEDDDESSNDNDDDDGRGGILIPLLEFFK